MVAKFKKNLHNLLSNPALIIHNLEQAQTAPTEFEFQIHPVGSISLES